MTGPTSDNEPAERVIELRLPSKLGYEKVSTLKKAEWLYDHFVDHYVYSLSAPKR